MSKPVSISIDLSKVFPDKLEELVLHISGMSENDSKFAFTKLNKLVWRADFEAFCETGRTVTGATYQKQNFGPVARAMPIVVDRLERTGRMKVMPVQMGSKPGKRPHALARADLGAFSQRELTVVARVVAENFGKTGTQMSNETHSHLAWQIAQTGETIPFAAWLIKKPKITAQMRARAEVIQLSFKEPHKQKKAA